MTAQQRVACDHFQRHNPGVRNVGQHHVTHWLVDTVAGQALFAGLYRRDSFEAVCASIGILPKRLERI